MASADESESTREARNRSFLLLNYLDSIEDSIENIFRKVKDLAQERDTLVTVLSQLEAESNESETFREGQYQEILGHIDRLKQRCLSIDIKIHTVRTDEQETSFLKVNSLIKSLEHICIQGNPGDETYKKQAESYLNACISDMPSGGPVDYKFQGMILDCKLEDQKQVRKRLECLVQGRIHDDFIDIMLNNSELEELDSNSDRNVSYPVLSPHSSGSQSDDCCLSK
ncbi:hypothetical protein Btru_040704 [Bulinus truncatus]|nr:hypothetical protein Btru_040704 [Bulinus truncatus]